MRTQGSRGVLAVTDTARTQITTEEKKKLLLLILVGGLVILMANKFLFPWIRHTAEAAYCSTYFGINGLGVLFAGLLLFTAGPVFGLCVYAVWMSVRTVRHQQFPPPGRYFIRPRRFQYGRLAVVRGYIGVVACGLLGPAMLVYAVYRMVPFIEMAASLEPSAEECAGEIPRVSESKANTRPWECDGCI